MFFIKIKDLKLITMKIENIFYGKGLNMYIIKLVKM